MNSEDKELVEKVKKKDTHAFELLIRKYIPRVYNWVRVSVPESDIDDVVQEVFRSLQFSIDRFKEKSSFYTYLYKITRFEIVDYYRASKRHKTEPFNDSSAYQLCAQDSQEALLNRDTVEVLVSHLSEIESQIIIMRFMDGYSFKEISDIIGLSYEAVRSKFRRALDKIHRYNKQEK